MKSHENPLKYHEYHENTLENHKNQPKTMKNRNNEKHRQQWLSLFNRTSSYGIRVSKEHQYRFKKRPSPLHRHKNLTIAQVYYGGSSTLTSVPSVSSDQALRVERVFYKGF